VMGIVLYTNTTIKGKEDFVRFMRNDEVLQYLDARPDNIGPDVVKLLVDRIKGRDIYFDDSVREGSLKEFIEEEDNGEPNTPARDELTATGDDEVT
jgi:hypothetical protein